MNDNPKIACFIHSTTLELWNDSILIGLLDSIKHSGLIEKLQHLCIVNTGIKLDQKKIQQTYYPAKVIEHSTNTLDFENSTIRYLTVFSKFNPEYKILYMHTKGVSYNVQHVFYPGVRAWNKYMTYCLLENHELCLNLLRIYDTVGTNYRPLEDGNGQHYSGNFWWANANYIQHLPIDYLKDKYHPEFWLLQNSPLYFNIHTIENMYEQEYPLENYKECVQRGFEDNILFCKVGFPRTGLCNQLYNIVNTMVIAAAQKGNKIIILDDFIKDINTLETVTINNVLDLPTMNVNLQNSHNIHLIYKDDIKMSLDKVEYGLKNVHVLDITDKIKSLYYRDNHLHIPQWTCMNDVIGMDPCPQMRKQIYIYYSLNGISFMKTFHERRLIFTESLDINYANFNNKSCHYVLDKSSPWLTRINRNDSKQMVKLFDHFLNEIKFQRSFYEEANHFIDSIRTNHTNKEKINILHIRNEEDALKHWSSLNSMSVEEYRHSYNSKYLDVVKKTISKNDMNIALTSFTEGNEIVEDLVKDGFHIHMHQKNKHNGREINAIIDLLIGEKCNSVFLGNINPHSNQGSTFSYVLYNKLAFLNDNVKCLTINVDNINEDVCVFHSV